MRSSCESDLVKRHPLHIAARWLGNTPRIAEKHYLITSDDDFDEAAGLDRDVEDEGGAESGAVSAPPGKKAVQSAVQHDPATDRIKQNPAGTYAKSCGAVLGESDSQGGESGIRNNAEKTGNPALSEQSGAECGAASARSNAVDTELARIIDAWPELPAEVKTAIVRLVENSGYAPVTD